MADVLRLHTLPDAADSDGEFDIKVGDEFPVLEIFDGAYLVEVDGYLMTFTLEPDEFGRSYRDWFILLDK